MSNPEEISHLIAPMEIDIGWACTLCHEGIEYTDSIARDTLVGSTYSNVMPFNKIT